MNPLENVGQVVLALLAIVALIAVLGFVARRLQKVQARTGGSLRIEDTLYLGAKERIVVLHHDNRELLIGITSQGMTKLHDRAVVPTSTATPREVA